MSTEDGMYTFDIYHHDEVYLRAKISSHERGYEFYPDCWDEDQNALDKLVVTISER